MKSGALKKVLVGLSVTVVLFFGLVAAIPFFVDVNKYRAEIEGAAGQHLNGKLTLGQMKLSAWGRLVAGVSELKITDSQGKSVFQVGAFQVRIPLWPLLTGSLRLEAEMEKPQLNLHRDKSGVLNLQKLAKQTGGTSSSSPGSENQKQAEAGGSTAAGGFLSKSSVRIEMKDASVSMDDELGVANLKLQQVGMVLDGSPSNIHFDFHSKVDLKSGTTQVSGPISLLVGIQNPLSFHHGDQASLAFKADDAVVMSGDSFRKPTGVPLGVTVKVEGGKDVQEQVIREFEAVIGGAKVGGAATLRKEGDATSVQGQFASSGFDLEALAKMVPALAAQSAKGQLGMKGTFSQNAQGLLYDVELVLKDVSLKPAGFKEALSVQGQVAVKPDDLKLANLALKNGALDLAIQGVVKSFARPQFQLEIKGAKLNQDQLMVATSPAAESSATEAKSDGQSGAGEGKPPISKDANAGLMGLKANPLVAAASGSMAVQIDELTTSGMPLRNFTTRLSWGGLALQVSELKFKLFESTFSSQVGMNLKGALPEVNLSLDLNGLNLQKMVETQFPVAKNTIKGVLTTKMNLSGKGLNRSEVANTWSGRGHLSISGMELSTLDVGQSIKTGLMDKIPEALKSKVQISDKLLRWKGRYKVFQTDFILGSGVMNLKDMNGQAEPQEGLDLKGEGQIQFRTAGSETLDIKTDFIDKYGLLGASFPKDQRYQMAALSTRLEGSLTKPTVDWGYTTQQLVKNTLKDTVKDKAKDLIKDKVNVDQLPGAAKGLLKGLFH